MNATAEAMSLPAGIASTSAARSWGASVNPRVTVLSCAQATRSNAPTTNNVWIRRHVIVAQPNAPYHPRGALRPVGCMRKLGFARVLSVLPVNDPRPTSTDDEKESTGNE